MAEAVNFDQAESSNEILLTFFLQTVQCERVANSLLNYIKSLRSMRDANRHVTSAMMDLCPSNWTGQDRNRLAGCLEDQGEVLNIAEGLIRTIFPRLKRHHLCINGMQSILLDLERKMLENIEMHHEFEEMKIHHRLTRHQEEQIRFMLRDTDKAIDIIAEDVADRLNGMDGSAYSLVKDVIMKFEEVQKIISSENLEIIQIVSNLIKTLPKPRPKISRLSQEDCSQIIIEFKENNSRFLETQKIMAANRKDRESSEKRSVKERIRAGMINITQSSNHDMESELHELFNDIAEKSTSDETTSEVSTGGVTEGTTSETTGGELSTVKEDQSAHETENKSERPQSVHEYEEARQAGSQQLLYQRDPNASQRT